MEGVSDSLTIGPLEVVRQVRVQTARRHRTVCVAHTGGLSLVALWDVLVHNFSPYDIQHTKSPKNPPRTHALDCMGEVSKLPGLTNSHGNHIYNCLTTDTVRGVLLYSLGVSRLPKPDCSERSCYLQTSGGGRASSLSLTLACWKRHSLNWRSES